MGLWLFSHEFFIVPEFPSPLLGSDILSKAQVSVFINMEPTLFNLNPRVWTDEKTVGEAQNTVLSRFLTT